MLEIREQVGAEGLKVLELVGEATVEHADQLREALLAGLRSQEKFELDCSHVERIDFFALQMICSAHRTAISWSKSLTLREEIPPVVKEAVQLIGFSRHIGCDLCPDGVCCMWARIDSDPVDGEI